MGAKVRTQAELDEAKQMLIRGDFSMDEYNAWLNAGGTPVNAGASTAVAEPVTEPVVEAKTPDPFAVCNKCDNDWSLANHAPQCGYKDATSGDAKKNALLEALKAQVSNGSVATPVQGLETVRVFELPFNETKKTTNYYAHTQAQKTADKSLPYENMYMDIAKYAKGSKIRVTVEVIA